MGDLPRTCPCWVTVAVVTVRCTCVLGKTTVLPSGFCPYWTGWNNLKRTWEVKGHRKIILKKKKKNASCHGGKYKLIQETLISCSQVGEAGKTQHFSRLHLWKSHKVSLLNRRNKTTFLATHPVKWMKKWNYSKQVQHSSSKTGKRMGPLYHFQRIASMASGLFIRKTLPHYLGITTAMTEILLKKHYW